MKVRLIFPIVAELARLDTVETQADTGYDDIFQEVRVKTVAGVRQSQRREKDPIRIRAQFEDDSMNALAMTNAGNADKARLGLIIDYTDLKKLGLLDPASGEPLFNIGDRLVGIYDRCGGLLQTIRPPGLYAIEVRPIAWGMARRVNLLLIRFDDRSIVGHDRA